MTSSTDGGSAFPVIAENGLGHISDGVSKREWFAGMALAGICGTVATVQARIGETQAEADARFAFARADAMLAESQKGGAS